MPAVQHALLLERNKLLAALPGRERSRLASHGQPVSFEFDQVLYETDGPIRHVYFPISGMISLLVVHQVGSAAEVARVGNEGMVGLPIFLGVSNSHTKALVQHPGEALRMKAPVLRKLARQDGPLHELLLRYTQALLAHSQRLTACNTWHTVEQRLCRWLLITHDRIQADQFAVTQDFLAQMLGVHRQSVTLAAINLQRAGLIRYSRGKLRILDRDGLEAAACECYRVLRRQFDVLLA